MPKHDLQLIVERKESMSPNGHLRLYIQDDGDVIVQVQQGESGLDKDELPCATVEFCTPFTGGGGSKHTHAALRQLAIAMAKDSADQNQQGRAGEFDGADILEIWKDVDKSSAATTLQQLEELLRDDWEVIYDHREGSSFTAWRATTGRRNICADTLAEAIAAAWERRSE